MSGAKTTHGGTDDHGGEKRRVKPSFIISFNIRQSCVVTGMWNFISLKVPHAKSSTSKLDPLLLLIIDKKGQCNLFCFMVRYSS